MKRIRPGTVTVGVLAILFGLLTAYVARHYFGAPTEGPQRRTATVVAPAVNLPKYSRIREEDLETIQVPIEDLPEGAVRTKSRALFRLVKETVMAGQPILEKDLYAVGEVPLLADQLPPGYRAVTLQVDANSALNGMIQPESHVDIALTVKGKPPEQGGLSTLTLLRGIQVLATSQARFPRSEDQPGNLRNITVAVSPVQANKLILAQRFGTLSVTLCSSLEADTLAKGEADNDLVNPNDLLGLAIPLVPEPVVKTAQIWRGGQVQQVSFAVSEIEESLGATAVAEGLPPMPVVPVSSPESAPAGHRPAGWSGCKDCQKKQPGAASAAGRVQPSTAADNVPTPAPPQSTTSLAAGGQLQRGPRGQVIYVQVEADAAGPASN